MSTIAKWVQQIQITVVEPNSEYDEYNQVYETLSGYYSEFESINSDKKGFLLSKASELSNRSYESMKKSSKYRFLANSEGSINMT